jgi:hypothetical protein
MAERNIYVEQMASGSWRGSKNKNKESFSVLPNAQAAYRRIRTLITVPTNKVDTPEWQVFIGDPQDLETALSRDVDEAAPQQG